MRLLRERLKVAQMRGDGGPSTRATEERNDRQDQKDDEQDLRDAGRGTRDAAKAEHGGNDRDEQDHQGVVKHRDVLSTVNGSCRQGNANPITPSPPHAGETRSVPDLPADTTAKRR